MISSRRYVTAAVLSIASLVTSCVTTDATPPQRDLDLTVEDLQDVRRKLRRVGLDLVDAESAALPVEERGRFVPVRTRREVESPALPHHPSGYLLVGVDRRVVDDAAQIFAALRDWRVGAPIVVTARRNPHLAMDVEWWEYEVRLVLPE